MRVSIDRSLRARSMCCRAISLIRIISRNLCDNLGLNTRSIFIKPSALPCSLHLPLSLSRFMILIIRNRYTVILRGGLQDYAKQRAAILSVAHACFFSKLKKIAKNRHLQIISRRLPSRQSIVKQSSRFRSVLRTIPGSGPEKKSPSRESIRRDL